MTARVDELFSSDADTLEPRWSRLQQWLQGRFDKEADLEGILFLIGVQETGRGYEPDLEKEVKERLVMEGTYCAFETLGLYRRVGMEKDGHWIWERRTDTPDLSIEQQETLLKMAILHYFDRYLEEHPDDV